ncbi:MAG TPA: protein-L-isoaspartate(D-aspartate) O-methyltransferase [Planctomycetota bacterium]|nr:protein-L-isoaspartate(D-aspartate) O-methyltransferase [Planctomycetota bacterium]
MDDAAATTLDSDATRERDAMVRDQIQARGVADPRVANIMRVVPRHLFVPAEDRAHAYEDCALPIGHGATISQPIVVATMLEALHLDGMERVLEIGTGSGYSTALLCELAGEVWSIELDAHLAQRAADLLRKLGYRDRLHLRAGHGEEGWPSAGPFDRIVLGCAPPHVPKPLLEQLADGGRLVAPVGPKDRQKLVAVERHGARFTKTDLGDVRFVPLRESDG